MYIGTQVGCRDETDIKVLSQLGVYNVDQMPTAQWTEWTAEMLIRMRERFDRYGINLEMIHIPLGSGSAFRNPAGAVFLRPGRGFAVSITILPFWATSGPNPDTVAAGRGCPLLNTRNWTSRLENSKAGRPMPIPCGDASTTGSDALCRWPKSTVFRWPAIRLTRV